MVLAGPDEGGYRTTLEGMAQERGLGDRVIFTGMVTGEAKAASGSCRSVRTALLF